VRLLQCLLPKLRPSQHFGPSSPHLTAAKISLDPRPTLAYLPATLGRTTRVPAGKSNHRDCSAGPAPGAHAYQSAGVSAAICVPKLAWRPAHRRSSQQSCTARHTWMCAAPSNRSRNLRCPLPPSDPLFSGAFFARSPPSRRHPRVIRHSPAVRGSRGCQLAANREIR